MLQQQLEIPTIRQLEDFIITECFYTSIIAGKLDQKKACLQVSFIVASLLLGHLECNETSVGLASS
eukprot:1147891-Pelagomonas_calceolata.AAC.6